MPGYLDGRAAIIYDLGSICNGDPAETLLPRVFRVHMEMGIDEFNRLSKLKNTVDLDYRQGDMSYSDMRIHVQEEVGEILRHKSVDLTEGYVDEILGVSDPSTGLIERIRRRMREQFFELEEQNPLVNPEVRTGCQLLDDAGAGFLGITDEPYFVAEPVAEHLLGLERPWMAAAKYPYNRNKRFTGEVKPVEEKGEVARNYLDYLEPDISIGLIDSPRDISMGERVDVAYVVDPEKPVKREMEKFVDENEDAYEVETPVEAFDHIYRDIVDSVKIPESRNSCPNGIVVA